MEVLKVNGHAFGALRRAWEDEHQRVEHQRAEGYCFLSTLLPPSIREVVFWGLDAVEMQAAMLGFAMMVVAGGSCPHLRSVVLAPSERSGEWGYSGWENADEWKVPS